MVTVNAGSGLVQEPCLAVLAGDGIHDGMQLRYLKIHVDPVNPLE